MFKRIKLISNAVMISINAPTGMLNCSNTVKTKQNLTVPCSEFLQKSFQNKDQIKQNQ